MPDTNDVLIAIAMMAGVVYLTRAGGYLVGLPLRRLVAIRPVLEVLPGCAFMAILVPAARTATPGELLALASLILILWKTDNVVVATLVGMGILLGGSYLATG